METPECIRLAYAAVENESASERRRRLANKRAAKYRYFSREDDMRRELNKARQRQRRETLDTPTREMIREQNRLRQKTRRQRMTEDDKRDRNQQQRQRRARMDQHALQTLREREKQRARRRRARRMYGGDDPAKESDANDTGDEQDAGIAGVHLPSERAAAAARLRAASFHLPMSTAQSGASSTTTSASMRADIEFPSLQLHPLRSLHAHQLQHTHHGIEIAPLQFVLPPASSIQSLTLADRMAPLPQVQNVLPHASTLLNAAATPSSTVPKPGAPSLPALAATLGSTSASKPGSKASLARTPSISNALPSMTASLSATMAHATTVPSTTGTIGSILNPPSQSPTLSPLLPPASHLLAAAQPQPPPLPPLSRLPDFMSNGRDLLDPAYSTPSGQFPSIAEFPSDFGDSDGIFRT